MSENKFSLSNLANHFKAAARDVREGANALTTRYAPDKGWSAWGHVNLVVAALRSQKYAVQTMAQNPEASGSLIWISLSLFTAACGYLIAGMSGRQGREFFENVQVKQEQEQKKSSTLSAPEVL